MRRRKLLGSLAGIAMLVGGASSPARADSFTFPSAAATAKTVTGIPVGNVRFQLSFEDGSYRHGGSSWAAKYTWHVEFDSLDEAFMMSFQPSGCGHAYSIDEVVRGKSWDTSRWFNQGSRLLTYSTQKIQDGIPPFGSATFTGYSNAEWGIGTLTARGRVLIDGFWQEWSAEATGYTMGCNLRNEPQMPKIELGVSASKSPVGTDETVGVTITIANTGGAEAENVLLTMSPIDHAAYVEESSTANGDPLPDVDALPAVINGGVLATVAAGETITLGFNVKINSNAAGKKLALAAKAELEGFPATTASADVPIIKTRHPELSMSLGASPNPVKTGGVFTATLEVKNSGDGDAKDVLVTAPAVPFTAYELGTTAVNGVAVADVNAGESALASGLKVDVPAGGVASITWKLKVANNAGDRTLDLSAKGTLAGHPDVSASASVKVVRHAELSMSLTASPDPVKTGGLLTVTLELKNSGDGDASDVLVTAPAVPFTSPAGGDNPAGGLKVNVPSGGSAKLTWTLKVADNAGDQTLSLSAKATLAGYEDVNAAASVKVARHPKLSATLTATPDPVKTGESLTVTLELKNSGDGDANGVTIQVPDVPATSYAPGSILPNGLVVNIPAGGSTTFIWTLVVASNAGERKLDLSAKATLADHEDVNAAASVQVIRHPKLSMSIAASPSPVGTGEVLSVSLVLSNSGDGDAKGVWVTAPAVPFTTAAGGSNPAGGMSVDVPAGGSITITWALKVANNAGGQTLNVSAKGTLAGHADVNASTSVKVVWAVPAAFDTLFAAIDNAQKAGAFRFKIEGHYRFSLLAKAAQKAWAAGDKKSALANLEQIMKLATWRGRYGNTPELFAAVGGTNYATAIWEAASKAYNLIRAGA
jgi:hypothetical protein